MVPINCPVCAQRISCVVQNPTRELLQRSAKCIVTQSVTLRQVSLLSQMSSLFYQP